MAEAMLLLDTQAGLCNQYYRKQVQLPIIECSAKGRAFRSGGIASDKLYYGKDVDRWQTAILHLQGTDSGNRQR